jgi:hypothetical protein
MLALLSVNSLVVSTCGTFGNLGIICYRDPDTSRPDREPKQWLGLSEDACKQNCENTDKTGCCESRTSGYCLFYPGGFSQTPSGYKDAHTTHCEAPPDPNACPVVGGSTDCCVYSVGTNETCDLISRFYDTATTSILHADGQTPCSDQFAPPQLSERLSVCPNYRCDDSSNGIECIGGNKGLSLISNGTLTEIECVLALQTQCKTPAPTPAPTPVPSGCSNVTGIWTDYVCGINPPSSSRITENANAHDVRLVADTPLTWTTGTGSLSIDAQGKRKIDVTFSDGTHDTGDFDQTCDAIVWDNNCKWQRK